MTKQYRIAWKMKDTGKRGHGEWFEPLEILLLYVNRLNEKHTDMSHWIEELVDDDSIRDAHVAPQRLED